MTGRARAAISGVLGGAGAVAVAAALLTGGGASPAEDRAVSPAAATAGAPEAEPAAATGHGGSWGPGDLAERWAQLPQDLRSDLAALRTVPAGERLAAIERIRDDALAGAYGEQARAGAERLAAGLAMLPPRLVADLEALVSLEVPAMPDAVERIRDRALTGQYGPQVQSGARHVVAMAEQHGIDVRGDLDRYLPGAGQAD